MTWTGCRLILLSMVAITLTGCGTMCPTMPTPPAKPTLPSWTESRQGGVSLDRHDTERLLRYVLELERGYQEYR